MIVIMLCILRTSFHQQSLLLNNAKVAWINHDQAFI
jgi:hypothetical protein